MSADEAQIWFELAAMCPPGTLGNSDRVYVEMTCGLLNQWRNDRDNMSSSDRSLLEKMLGKLGCSPTDRPRVSVPPAKAAENPFAIFD